MKCIGGLLTPDKGELLYDHRNFLAMGKKEKKENRDVYKRQAVYYAYGEIDGGSSSASIEEGIDSKKVIKRCV